jgi:hypothetical protein
VNGVAVGVVDAVNAEFLVEPGAQGRVAAVEGVDQPAGLLQEASYLLRGGSIGSNALLLVTAPQNRPPREGSGLDRA